LHVYFGKVIFVLISILENVIDTISREMFDDGAVAEVFHSKAVGVGAIDGMW